MLEMLECLMYNSITCQKVGLKIQIGFVALWFPAFPSKHHLYFSVNNLDLDVKV